MRRLALLLLGIFAVGLVGCSGEEPEPDPLPAGESTPEGKKGAAKSGPKLELNPNYEGK